MNDPTVRDARRRARAEPSSPERAGDKYALVIGINDYGARHRALRNAVNDAQVVAGRLEDDFGFAVTLLVDQHATGETIRSCLTRWQADVRREDAILIFFAGHGTSIRAEGTAPEGYLLPNDADDDPASWLPEAEIVERVRAMAAGRIFLVLDACYAGTALRLSQARPPSGRDDQVLEILVAGTEDEPVLDAGAGDHSIFTRAVLDGLDGLADVGKRPDGVVTAGELTAYVRSEVPWRSRLRGGAGFEQTPVGGSLQGTRAGLDFEFQPSRPRLPAALLRNVYSSQAEDRIAAAAQLQERRGTETAALAAEELLHLVRNDRGQEGDPILAGKDLLRVQCAAVEALGELGHVAGLALLIDLVSQSGDEPRLRKVAAPALGRLLAQKPAIAPGDRQAATDALIGALRDPDPGLREAAKTGLGHVPAASDRLEKSLSDRSAPRGQIVDALAGLALAQPGEAGSWPGLSPADSLRRRYYLLRRRLSGPLRELMIHAAIVGLAGTVGLGLAFVPVTLAAYPDVAQLYVPATLAVCALPGFLAGVAYAALPPLSRAAGRPRPGGQGRGPTLVGLLLAGLAFGACLALPNWFLSIDGVPGGAPPRAWVNYVLPGLVAGPIIGLVLGTLLRQPARAAIQPGPRTEDGNRRQALGVLGVALAAGVAFALVRIPPALAIDRINPSGAEQLLWSLGGFLFGLLLAAAWSLPLSPGEGAAPAIGQAWTFLTGDRGSE